MQNKLTSIHMSDNNEKDVFRSQEHPAGYFIDGWTVKSITPVGAGAGGYSDGLNDSIIRHQTSYVAG